MLCSEKRILVVNDAFPGPTIMANVGDTVVVNVSNQGDDPISIHWHGVKQLRNPWNDGPAYITQCPIQPNSFYVYTLILSDEVGTLWWHAHIHWARLTVYGAIQIYPRHGTNYPFAKPNAEATLILASWYKGNANEMVEQALRTGGDTNVSDALLINGLPGLFHPCSSRKTTYSLKVRDETRILLRIINAAMNEVLQFGISNHTIRVVAMDGAFVRYFDYSFILISPGQTMDVVVSLEKPGFHLMAARAFENGGAPVTNATATAIMHYNNSQKNDLQLPILPATNDSDAAINFVKMLRGAGGAQVPQQVDKELFIIVSVNLSPCPNKRCLGPLGMRLSSSLNNCSLVLPNVSILEAYSKSINNSFSTDFPTVPEVCFNYTSPSEGPKFSIAPHRGTRGFLIEHGKAIQIVFQGTSGSGAKGFHPIHLHGFSFFLVGFGLGNYNETDDETFNLVDPPLINTFLLPMAGWGAIRFIADNPGVWFLHCHLERHTMWGMATFVIVQNGPTRETSMLPRPPNMPPCGN